MINFVERLCFLLISNCTLLFFSLDRLVTKSQKLNNKCQPCFFFVVDSISNSNNNNRLWIILGVKYLVLLSLTDLMKRTYHEIHFVYAQFAEDYEIEWDPISSCLNSQESSELLAMYGDETHRLEPTPTNLPHVRINGHLINYRGFDKSLICSKYCGEKPPACPAEVPR